MLPIYEIRKESLSVKRNAYELEFPEHMHGFIEIVYTYKGVQHMRIENKEYSVTEGNAAVIFPDTVHSYFAEERRDTEVLILMCESKLFGSLFPDLKKLRADTPYIDTSLICDELRYALNAIYPSQPFETQFSWACVIVSYIFEILKPEQTESTPMTNMIYKLMSYIDEHFTEDISREMLARKFNVSECYISRLFASRFRMNLRAYIGIKRAEYAADLIRTSDATFTDISRFAGFGSLRSFNRIFKEVYGVTPKEYKGHFPNDIKNMT